MYARAQTAVTLKGHEVAKAAGKTQPEQTAHGGV